MAKEDFEAINMLIREYGLDEEEFFFATHEAIGSSSVYIDGSDLAEFSFEDGSKASIRILRKGHEISVMQSADLNPDQIKKISDHISGFSEVETREMERTLLSTKRMNGVAVIGEGLAIFPVGDLVRRGGVVGLPGADSERAPQPLSMSVLVRKPKNSEAFCNRNYRELEITENFVLTLVRGIHPFPRFFHDSVWVVTGHDAAGIMCDPLRPSIGFIEQPSREYAKGHNIADFEDYLDDYDNSLLLEKQLQFPAKISEAYERFVALKKDIKDRFVRSMFFFRQGEILRSLKLEFRSSYVSAIEALLEPYRDKCPACNQDKYALTRRFADFMDTYAPYEAKIHLKYAEMYKQRSQAVHGVFVPEADSIGLRYDQAMIDNVLFPWRVRKAIVGYLLSQA